MFFFSGVKMPTTKKTQKLGEEKHSFSPPFFAWIDLNFSGGGTNLETLNTRVRLTKVSRGKK